METIPPVHADAFRLLHTDLRDHLCEAEDLASRTDEWSAEDMESVRRLIPDLLVAIRGLLIEHKATPSGTCRSCPSAWPCPVVTTLHALVKDPTGSSSRSFAALTRTATWRRTAADQDPWAVI